ncbi:MAG: hypothetical protein J6T74_03760 [Clostridia bacterium]|nr:hypothetical protein [Clostridia bacterium]
MKVLKIAFVIVGAKIGAGFASGKEIFEYFAKFGAKSLFFVPFLFVLLYSFTYILLTFGSNFKKYSLKEGNNALMGKICVFKKTFNIFDFFMFMTFLILSSAMFTGLVSLFQTYFTFANKWALYLVVLLITITLIKISFNAISSISYFIVPLIVICIVINAAFTFNPSSFTTSLGSISVFPLPFLTILYASQNTFLASFIIIKSGFGLSKLEQKKVSLIVALVICSLLTIGILCFLFNPSLSYSNMPFAEISKNVDTLYSYIFGFIIFSSIITTYATTITSLKEYFKEKEKNGAVIMLGLISILSLVDFSHIIQYLYPIIGIFGAIYIYSAYNKSNLSFKFFFKNAN